MNESRLSEIERLTEDWDGEGSKAITASAIGATRHLLRFVKDQGFPRASIFPTSDSGVLMEWDTRTGIVSVEMTEDGKYELFTMNRLSAKPGHHYDASFTLL